MDTSRLSELLLAALVAFLSGTLGCVLAISLFPPSPPPPQQMPHVKSDGIQSQQFDSLTDALAQIKDRISNLQGALAGQDLSHESTEVAPAGDPPTSEIPERLDAIERHLASLLSTSRNAVAAGEPVPRGVPNNWQALQNLHYWKEQDHRAAKNSVALLTLPEIIARYGSPTKVSSSKGKLRITFYRVDPAGNNTGYVAFQFVDGRVCYLDSRLDP